MKKIITILLILFSLIILQSKEIIVNGNTELFNTIYSNLETTELEFNLDKYEMEEIVENGVTYQKISYPMEGELYQIGKPDLPVFTRFVAIPNTGGVKLTVTYKDFITLSNILVYPRQSDEVGNNSFIIDEDFYSKNIEFPQKITKLYQPKILRNYRVVPVSFSPFQYNPQTKILKIYKKIKVTITSTKAEGINEKHLTQKQSRVFEKFYQDIIVNYDYIKERDQYQRPCLLIVYYDNNNLAQMVNILADWKKQKGFEVHIASTAETGSTKEQIKDYIETAYFSWENPPEFIMLVGDANNSDTYFIPTGQVDSGAGDQYYTLLEGDDILADVIIGRLSVDTLVKMQTVVQKILNYEKTPYLGDTNWYKKALLVGDPSQSGPSTISTNKYIKDVIQTVYPENEFLEQYSGNYVNFMESGFNEGVLYFNYRGYIGMSGFGNSNIENLNNGYMLPYVIDITCATGNFNSGSDESRSETFLFAGSPTNPKGGIAAIGTATSATHTCFNNIVSASIYHSIFIEDIQTTGGALTNAKYHLYLNYPQNPANHTVQFSYWNNLMGDPSLQLWTEQPKQLNMDYSDIITVGTNYLQVHCYDDTRNPLSNVWVTVVSDDGQINDTGFTDENGNIILNVANASIGTIKLTATKENYIPALQEVTVVSHYLSMALAGYILDDSQGNGDGLPNPGENVLLSLQVLNNGSGSISNLSASIIGNSDNITLINSEVNFNGTINPNETAISTNQFEFTINPDVLANQDIRLEVELSSANLTQTDYIILDLTAPLLIFDTYYLPGNGNMILDPGETSNLIVALKNVGNEEINDISAVLSCESSYITISDDAGYYDSIQPNETIANINDIFVVEASVELVPGMLIPLTLDLTNPNGFHQQITFNLSIGEQTLTDPLGPDAYGYFMYDDGDVGYASTPQYAWIELDPAEGGDGEILSLNDMDDDDSAIQVIDLPINFKFYGTLYNKLTICSDGWVSPGEGEQESFMNWRLPGPLAPMPLIAPFWDDLKMDTDSKVLYKYYSDSNILVVEWSNMKNDFDESYTETFEVILYDYTVSPTSTGDSNILFQYNEINNVDQGEYGSYHVHHGQYATVGIQNETGTIGLEYTFNNDYPIPAKPLQNEMAIAITGKPISYEEAFLTFASANILDDNNHNNQIDFGENIQMYIQLNNMGHQPAQNVTAIISTSDSYVTMQNAVSSYPDIDELSSAVNEQPFTFSVSSDVPDGHNIVFNLQITSSNNTWSYIITQIAHSANIQYSTFKILNDTNLNGILEPGEMCDLMLRLNNVGGTPLKNITATIFSNDEHLIINDNSFNWPYIYGNREFGTVFKITTLADTPEQYSIPITLVLESDGGYATSIDCLIFMGASIEDFETGDFNLFPWEFDNNPWVIAEGDAQSGNYCAQSIDISDSQQADMHLSVNVPSQSQISFYYKVSSENNWDYLRFFIDDTEIQNWSGEIDWAQAQIDVPAGNHTLHWVYTKDGSVSSGQDCAWVDYIQLPGSNGGEVPEPELMFSYDSFNYVVQPDTIVYDTLAVTNIGQGLVNYTVEAQNDFDNILMVNETEGSVYTGHINYITFVINTIGVENGTYNASIIITDNREVTTIPIEVSVQEVDENPDELPMANKLFTAYPNPFRLSNSSKYNGAVIKFALNEDSAVKLEIYNLKGQKVKTILKENLKAGIYQSVWDGTNTQGKKVTSGLYLYKLKTKNFEKIKKMIVLR